MQELLHIKLHDYLAVHHPDLLLGLSEEGKEVEYIQEKVACISGEMETMLACDTPAYLVEIHCMDILTNSLEPSKYDYIYNILEEEFEGRFAALETQSILLYEVINLITYCKLPEAFDEDDRLLKYRVVAAIDEYFTHPQTKIYGV